jgi:uncharacterized membrane protein YbjE (DUF340 family)
MSMTGSQSVKHVNITNKVFHSFVRSFFKQIHNFTFVAVLVLYRKSKSHVYKYLEELEKRIGSSLQINETIFNILQTIYYTFITSNKIIIFAVSQFCIIFYSGKNDGENG